MPHLRSACFDNSLAVHVSLTDSLQYHWPVHQRPWRVLLCLYDNACERSLAICHKSRALCPVSRVLSDLYSLHVLNRNVDIIQMQNNNNQVKNICTERYESCLVREFHVSRNFILETQSHSPRWAPEWSWSDATTQSGQQCGYIRDQPSSLLQFPGICW